MTETALQILDAVCDPLELSAELAMDQYHPANDQYQQSIRMIHQAITAQSALIGSKKAEAARLHVQGMTHVQISKRIGYGPPTIGKYLKEPQVVRFIQLIRHLRHAQDGATTDHRKAVLWRIAMDNERNKPNVAVQAIQEINKMSGAYQVNEGQNVINIQINNEMLPRTSLDVDFDSNVGKS